MKTYMKFACIYCGQRMECDPRFGGRQMLCPACRHRIVIPGSNGGSSAGQFLRLSQTWDSRVPMPMVEVPTRYHLATALPRRGSRPVRFRSERDSTTQQGDDTPLV